MPESTCTAPLVETARETMPSFATSSSRVQLIVIPVLAVVLAVPPEAGITPTDRSSSIISLSMIFL